MCSQQQVNIKVVGCGPHQGTRFCPTFWYITHIHKVYVILHIFCGPIWGLIEDYDVFSDPALHVVSRAVQKL